MKQVCYMYTEQSFPVVYASMGVPGRIWFQMQFSLTSVCYGEIKILVSLAGFLRNACLVRSPRRFCSFLRHCLQIWCDVSCIVNCKEIISSYTLNFLRPRTRFRTVCTHWHMFWFVLAEKPQLHKSPHTLSDQIRQQLISVKSNNAHCVSAYHYMLPRSWELSGMLEHN